MKPKSLVPLVQVPNDIQKWPVCAVDLGFATESKSVGLTCNMSYDKKMNDTKSFSQAVECVNKWLVALQKIGKEDVALVLEAPLSMSFNQEGNPCCRNIELTSNYRTHHKPSSTKGWFYGAGAILTNASQVFLSRLEIPQGMKVHIAEGFYTKIRGIPETHTCDRTVAMHLRDRLIRLAGLPLDVPISGYAKGTIEPLLGLLALGFDPDKIPGIVFREELIFNPTTTVSLTDH
jgi:hypothetical protein